MEMSDYVREIDHEARKHHCLNLDIVDKGFRVGTTIERDKRHNNWQLHEQIITRGQESSLRVTKLLLKSMEPWQDQKKKNYIQN